MPALQDKEIKDPRARCTSALLRTSVCPCVYVYILICVIRIYIYTYTRFQEAKEASEVTAQKTGGKKEKERNVYCIRAEEACEETAVVRQRERERDRERERE